MSLVHEALQKAEREKQRKTGVWHAPEPKPASKPVQQFGSTDSLPAMDAKPATGSPVESVATSTAVTTFAVSPSPSQAAVADPQKKQSGLLPVLIVCVSLVAIVAIVFLVSLSASTIRESRPPARAAGDVQPTAPTAVTEPKPNESTPQTVVASPASGVASAPMGVTAPQPSTPPPGSVEAGFRLTGIMILPDGKYAAVLNGHVAYEADDVGGATVKSIQRDRITLVDAQGKEMVLRLN